MNEAISTEKQSSIELAKTTKGYTWKIKFYFDPDRTPKKTVIYELEKSNELMKSKFGGQ